MHLGLRLILICLPVIGSTAVADITPDQVQRQIASDVVEKCPADTPALVEAIVASKNVKLASFQVRQKLRRSITDQHQLAECMASINNATETILQNNGESDAVRGVADVVKENTISFLRMINSLTNKPDNQKCNSNCGGSIIGTRG